MQDILVVVDMQNDFIDGTLGTKEAIAIVPKVEEKIRNFKGTVLFTRDTHETWYLDTQEGKKLPVPHCIRNTEGWQIRSELDKLRKTEPIDKDTFGSTDLADELVAMNIDDDIGSITFIGLCTDICVISNALLVKAALPEVPIIVDAACCAGVTPESHENALNAMKMCQIDPQVVSECTGGNEMKELKKEFRWFNIMEYEKEENYLSKRHQEGWKFKRVTFPGVYTFERCESEKVIYQLDYNKEGIKHQMEYVRMFEDCGWEYLTEFDGYNYFRKPADKMQQEEEIFCDDISRLDMMNRIFIGRVIPLIVILCGLIWQLYISATDHSERGWLPIFIVLVIIYIITFLQFAVKYFAFRKKVK